MLFLRAGEVGPAPASVSAEPMAKRAIDAEFVLARLGGLGIAGQGIAIFGGARGCRVNDQGQDASIEECNAWLSSYRTPRLEVEGIDAPFAEFAAFYAKDSNQPWKSSPLPLEGLRTAEKPNRGG